jgi:hypothetical protein
VPKSDLPIGGEYAPVADRIALFYERFPAGRIITQLTMHNEREVVFRASVYRTEKSRTPAATGWASEKFGDGDINTVACLENTETSAIGRALANLGFTASKNRPSLEEMEKVARVETREIAGRGSGASSPRALLVRESSSYPIERDPLQRRANEISETLNLLTTAESYGMRRSRVERIRERLIAGAVPAEGQRRIQQLLRDWLANQRKHRRKQSDSFPTPTDGSR